MPTSTVDFWASGYPFPTSTNLGENKGSRRLDTVCVVQRDGQCLYSFSEVARCVVVT